ncbi:MAG TPA: FtsK/SpoIIIE domain-containing protein [Actinomycetes bacterium]|jgi:hypothetical protein|nr:FtsK/SpoIIIE domain-containing protein [Actinomycetes bacterium]
MPADQRAFLGWTPRQASPTLVAPRTAPDGAEGLAAVWPYGPGYAPHMLVVGTTGGGKTSAKRVILVDRVTAPGRRKVVIIDGKGGGDYTMFRGQPAVAEIVNVNPLADPESPEKAAAAVKAVLAEVRTRNAATERAQREAWATRRTPAYSAPPELWLVIDEWMSLIYQCRKLDVDLVGDAIEIGRVGRSTDTHLLIGTQRPDTKSVEAGLPGELKAQLGARVAAVGPLGLRKLEAIMAFDDAEARRLVPRELGGCLLMVGDTFVPYVTPYMPNPTSEDPSITDEQRARVWALLPAREAA